MFCVFLEVMDTDSANPQSIVQTLTPGAASLSLCTRGPWGEKTAYSAARKEEEGRGGQRQSSCGYKSHPPRMRERQGRPIV